MLVLVIQKDQLPAKNTKNIENSKGCAPEMSAR